MDTITATRQGICVVCGGFFPRLYCHVRAHYRGLSAEQATAAYRKEWKIPDNIPLMLNGAALRLTLHNRMRRLRRDLGSR